MTAKWPWQGDTSLQRARRLANSALTMLASRDPEAARILTGQAHEYGETWLGSAVVRHELDEWVDPATAAELAGVDVATIRQWRRRDKLAGQLGPDGWAYQVQAVLQVAADTRRKRAGLTVA